MQSRQSSIVVIGGGTGTYTVLSGLKRQTPRPSLTAIVSMADSGGSTGRLRDEFGYLPVGDVRQALAALADEHQDERLLRALFMHRFATDGELSGHNVGNLLLMALTDLLGSEEEAVAAASRILRVGGTVLPVTADDAHLCAQYADGTVRTSESEIDEPPAHHDGTQRITNVWLQPAAVVTESARAAIEQADAIVLGPGDLYTSTVAALCVAGVPEAIQQSRGALWYVPNLMAKDGQTNGYTARDHLTEVERYAGRQADRVLMNATAPAAEKLPEYAAEHGHPVVDDFGDDTRVLRRDLMAGGVGTQQTADVVPRSFIRHDPDKLARAINEICRQ